MNNPSPAIRLVPPISTTTFEVDGEPVIVRRGDGLTLLLMRSTSDRAPFVVHFKRRRVPVVNGWGYTQVTRWTWGVGWQHGSHGHHVSYILSQGKPIEDYTECRIEALTMALAWMRADDPKAFLDQEWRRRYGLKEAERLRRGIADMVETFGLD